jgi:hypothetical protein
MPCYVLYKEIRQGVMVAYVDHGPYVTAKTVTKHGNTPIPPSPPSPQLPSADTHTLSLKIIIWRCFSAVPSLPPVRIRTLFSLSYPFEHCGRKVYS